MPLLGVIRRMDPIDDMIAQSLYEMGFTELENLQACCVDSEPNNVNHLDYNHVEASTFHHVNF